MAGMGRNAHTFQMETRVFIFFPTRQARNRFSYKFTTRRSFDEMLV
jgi:hypothetical protein